jgi:hypothetical protein
LPYLSAGREVEPFGRVHEKLVGFEGASEDGAERVEDAVDGAAGQAATDELVDERLHVGAS